MSLEMTTAVHQSRIEEKFAVIKKSATEFVGKYPLEAFSDAARGTYGGDFVAQSLVAAWETVEDKLFHPHSLHAYFLKAGLVHSVMRYEVEPMTDGRNFCSRQVKCYQLHSNQLCFILNASFTKDNSIASRKEKFSKLTEEEQHHKHAKVPLEFMRKPNALFDKYMDKVDTLPQFEHTNGNMTHAIPPETMKYKTDKTTEPGSKLFGLFGKVNDDLENAKDRISASIIDFAFLSDSFYLSTLVRAMNINMHDEDATNFFRVSLDHAIFFHDADFDPTEWMFIDYLFSRMSNNRALVTAQFYTKEKKLVATVQQEALVFIPMDVAKKTSGGSYKL
ncbi:CIC11C00000001016 [Sungouiella intermedia]|uniref:CIC11C00000001016 n=1 Tax=Sungouiella intermedia TaxID=45354 RepID=A0A1L0B6N6_9ASCO|nr:CIC11C00000001016 [[Candida] intermedia]